MFSQQAALGMNSCSMRRWRPNHRHTFTLV
jgi:hypothetical protein